MHMDDILLEIKLDDIIINWQKLYNVFKKVENLPVKEQIEKLLPLLPGGIENQQGKVLDLSDIIPHLKDALRQHNIRIDKTAQRLINLLGYIGTEMNSAQFAGYPSLKMALGVS